MARSMTAFARAQTKNISWEIRSVNQRYLDVSFRMPEAYRALEIQLKKSLRQQLHRGKLDCVLRVDKEQIQTSLTIDSGLVKSLGAAVSKIDDLTGEKSQVDAVELLRWPGVILEDDIDVEAEQVNITETFGNAVGSLVEMREREGDELRSIVLAQLEELASIVDQIRLEAPAIVEHQRNKLQDKLSQIEVEVDDGRLEQEFVYLAQKSDTMEELDRLDTHIAEVQNTLNQTGPIGRRLDFLMQELNREANTLSSKATSANTSLQTVDLKVIIEQMREQIQNLE
ncbi:MAG: YicC family protein [Gammaproteobacteria bacterium]|nr:YicC family protein [Gammaproteobacteria bacterium]